MAESTPPKKPGPSPLKRVYDVAERAVASRAEPVTQSGGFANVLGVYVSVNRRIGRVLGKATGGILHLVNIPTASDIGKLHQHLSSVDTHIAELIVDMERQDAYSEASTPVTDPKTTPSDADQTRRASPERPKQASKATGSAAKSGRGSSREGQ